MHEHVLYGAQAKNCRADLNLDVVLGCETELLSEL